MSMMRMMAMLGVDAYDFTSEKLSQATEALSEAVNENPLVNDYLWAAGQAADKIASDPLQGAMDVLLAPVEVATAMTMDGAELMGDKVSQIVDKISTGPLQVVSDVINAPPRMFMAAVEKGLDSSIIQEFMKASSPEELEIIKATAEDVGATATVEEQADFKDLNLDKQMPQDEATSATADIAAVL